MRLKEQENKSINHRGCFHLFLHLNSSNNNIEWTLVCLAAPRLVTNSPLSCVRELPLQPL